MMRWLVLAFLLCAGPLWAGRSAVIVSNNGDGAAALKLSRALMAQGYVVERRVGLRGDEEFPSLAGDLRVVFFAGRMADGMLAGADGAGGWPLPSAGPQLLALNVCEGVEPPPDTLLVQGCGADFVDDLVIALETGGDLAAALAAQGLAVSGTIAPVPARVASAAPAQMRGDVVISAPVLAPLQPVGGGDVRILAASADALRARPVAAGMPRPSVIVGVEPDTPAPPPARITDVDERLRQRSETDYAEKVALGLFDPDEGDVTRAIQAELQRLGCYAGTVDGVWGNGSRSAVGQFNQGAVVAMAAEPDMASWRALIAAPEDRRCAAPVAAPTAAPTPQRSTPQRARPAAPTEPEPERPTIAPGFLGTGIFR